MLLLSHLLNKSDPASVQYLRREMRSEPATALGSVRSPALDGSEEKEKHKRSTRATQEEHESSIPEQHARACFARGL